MKKPKKKADRDLHVTADSRFVETLEQLQKHYGLENRLDVVKLGIAVLDMAREAHENEGLELGLGKHNKLVRPIRLPH